MRASCCCASRCAKLSVAHCAVQVCQHCAQWLRRRSRFPAHRKMNALHRRCELYHFVCWCVRYLAKLDGATHIFVDARTQQAWTPIQHHLVRHSICFRVPKLCFSTGHLINWLLSPGHASKLTAQQPQSNFTGQPRLGRATLDVVFLAYYTHCARNLRCAQTSLTRCPRMRRKPCLRASPPRRHTTASSLTAR